MVNQAPPFVLDPRNNLHQGLAQIRVRLGRCPRCDFHPALMQRCAVCLFFMQAPGRPGVFFDGFPLNDVTLQLWAQTWLSGGGETPQTRDEVAAYVLEHRRPPAWALQKT